MIGQLVLGLWAATRRTSTKRVLPAVSAPSENEPKRPDGPLIWLNATTETDRAAGKLLAQHLAEKRPDLAIVVNCDLPPEEQSEVIPDHPNVICAPLGAGPRAFLARWKPDLIVHIVDATDPDPMGQIRTVHEVIAEVDGSSIEELIEDAPENTLVKCHRSYAVNPSLMTGINKERAIINQHSIPVSRPYRKKLNNIFLSAA